MRKWLWIAGLPAVAGVAMLLLPTSGTGAPQQEKGPDLSWAFPVPDANPPAASPDDGKPVTVPGTTKTYTHANLADAFNPPDWFPDEHPAMPLVVAHGHTGTDIRACDLCHLTSGQGHPESANMAGMPAAYLERQIAAWKRGQRKNGGAMVVIAKKLSDEDAQEAAEYFASLKPTNWVRVVETDTVPQTYVDSIFMRMRRPGGAMEPLGNRIIEVPEDETRTENRDPHSGTIAWVPKGSIAKGQALVQTGAGKTIPCGTCHGDALTGLAEVPRIAGLSPLYLTRALYNFQGGVTPGTWSELMKKPTAALSYDDIVDIAAYLASLPASGAPVTPGIDVGSNGGGGSAPAASAANTPPANPPAGGPAGAASSGGSGASSDLVAQGQTLFNKYKCYDCHGMHGEGTDDGPDLIGTRLSGEEIAAFLHNPDADARTKGMPDFATGSPEIAPLVAFVLSIKQNK